ncbi:MAG: C40 family peptidase [Firmicutes bacterium]|nr:C40 family peptidase [Bacillota bacterium]
MRDERVEALLATAYDYYNHREHIQYDQRSMDRYVQITPRRRKYFPPEAGTAQYTHHLDCSGFCFAVYYQALGYELPYDITWHMYEHMAHEVFRYEKTFDETYEEKKRITAELAAAIRPGDLITMLHQGQSGHIMIALEDGKFMHCVPAKSGTDDSYDYTAKFDKKNRFGLSINDIADITEILTDEEAVDVASFKRYNLFSPKESKIVIHRPWLDSKGPTEQAMVRMGAHKGLISGVESSHPGGQQAVCGDVVEYRVQVKNVSEEVKSVTVEFTAPAGTSFGGENLCEAKLAGGEEKIFTFGVIVEKEAAAGKCPWIEAPGVKVNGLEIHAKKVLLGRTVTAEEFASVVVEVCQELAEGCDVVEAAAKIYGKRGIQMDPGKKNHIHRLFHHFDTCAKENNNILVRREQKPFEDMAVYSLFGGKSVVTGDILLHPDSRTTEITSRDLMAGDIILCGNDVFAGQTHALFFTGDSLVGAPEQGLKNRELKGQEMESFMNSLFGRFVWIVLRPWQAAQ